MQGRGVVESRGILVHPWAPSLPRAYPGEVKWRADIAVQRDRDHRDTWTLHNYRASVIRVNYSQYRAPWQVWKWAGVGHMSCVKF